MCQEIMPLAPTDTEILNTADVLHQLLADSQCYMELAQQLGQHPINQLIFIGSGDSFAIAMMAASCFEHQLAIFSRAIQSYEFIRSYPNLVLDNTLIVIISASGRPSPVVEALKIAVSLPVITLGITNAPGTVFSTLPQYVLYTHAHKQGMPTQSTSATLLALNLLALAMGRQQQKISQTAYSAWQQQLSTLVNGLNPWIDFSHNYWQSAPLEHYVTQPIILLGSGEAYALATIGSNLLACGPELLATAFLIEEYHHSLRLLNHNQPRRFILLLDSPSNQLMFIHTANTLAEQGADVLLLTAIEPTEPLHPAVERVVFEPVVNSTQFTFYSLIFLQIMSVQLAHYIVKQGGQRTTIPRSS